MIEGLRWGKLTHPSGDSREGPGDTKKPCNSALQGPSYPERDLNPHDPFGSTEFKSVVSTNSTIRASAVEAQK